MFGMFKKDPAEKLRKEHARLLSKRTVSARWTAPATMR